MGSASPLCFARAHPLLVADDCCVRNSVDQDVLVLVVCRLYPSTGMCATPCDVKGAGRYNTHMHDSCMNGSGAPRMVYRCDQERSIDACITTAANHVDTDAT